MVSQLQHYSTLSDRHQFDLQVMELYVEGQR